MLADPPIVLLLEAMKADVEAVDFSADAGVEEQVTVAHARHRKPVKSEKPKVTLVFVDDDAVDQAHLTEWEQQRQLDVDVQVDRDLPTEDSEEDPTGLKYLTIFAAAAVEGIRKAGSQTSLLTDYTVLGRIGPDEKSQPDEGRLVVALSVLYRVRTDDGNVLLAAGVNA